MWNGSKKNMMAMAGGLAASGQIPFVTTLLFYAWSIEQARLSVTYANMNVKIIASHPVICQADVASAQCLEDLYAPFYT